MNTVPVDYSILFYLKNLTFRSSLKSIIRTETLLKIYNQWYLKIIKNWYCSFPNIPFISFNTFITSFLHTVEFYVQMSQTNSFKENDLMLLFNWSWSRLINKRSPIRSLNLVAPEARISKWSNSIEQLHLGKWSDSAD